MKVAFESVDLVKMVFPNMGEHTQSIEGLNRTTKKMAEEIHCFVSFLPIEPGMGGLHP